MGGMPPVPGRGAVTLWPGEQNAIMKARSVEDGTERLRVLPGRSSSPMGLEGPLEGLVGTVIERGMTRTKGWGRKADEFSQARKTLSHVGSVLKNLVVS